ncbi:MAG: SCO family protein [Ginsengibacter sp.]
MKKYISMLCCLIILYSCNNTINTADAKLVSKDSSEHKKPTEQSAAQSIFIVADTFKTQHNKDVTLTSFAGKPTVVGMIFTNCGYACPRLTSDMKGIAEKLQPNREKVNFVLISFDTERDTPAQLVKFAKKMELDNNWVLLHGSNVAVRTLSVLLNVQFEKDAEGNFSHSNLISVLDKNGVLVYQKEGLEEDHKETVDKINALLK